MNFTKTVVRQTAMNIVILEVIKKSKNVTFKLLTSSVSGSAATALPGKHFLLRKTVLTVIVQKF